MGSEAISRGPRGGTPVRSNRREVISEEAAEESGERKVKHGCRPKLSALRCPNWKFPFGPPVCRQKFVYSYVGILT